MKEETLTPQAAFSSYARRLCDVIKRLDLTHIEQLAKELLDCWQNHRQVFLCGNGGSAGNAMHIANDFIYGIAKDVGPGLRVTALPANSSVLTCLANDEGYDHIFSLQLAALARRNDVLIVLSGSGNSPNILYAIEKAARLGMRTYAILGFDGGKAKTIADHSIHFPINDMQISEDLQLVVGHMVMQWLCKQTQKISSPLHHYDVIKPIASPDTRFTLITEDEKTEIGLRAASRLTKIE